MGCQCELLYLLLPHTQNTMDKVYWQDGGQIVPPEDAGIINVIET
jgi:hypothetical protein